MLRGGSFGLWVGVLTITVGGTVPELHRLAVQLSPQLPKGTSVALFDCEHNNIVSSKPVKYHPSACYPTSFHLDLYAGYHEIDFIGSLGNKLVSFAQNIAIDAAQLILWYQAQAHLVRDDYECGVQPVHAGDELFHLG